MSISFTLGEALYIGLLYFLAYCEIHTPLPIGFPIQDASAIGLLVGIFYGQPTQGLIVGTSIAMLYIANGAYGANLPSDGVLAACIGVPLALKMNLPIEQAIAVAIPFGILGTFVDTGRRLINGIWNRRAVAHAQKKEYAKIYFDGLVGPQIINAAVRIIPVALLLYLFGGAAGDIIAKIPAWLSSGLGLIGAMLPGLGLVLCVIYMGKKELVPYFFVGYYISYFLGYGYIFIALIAAFLAYLHIQFTSYKFEDDEDDFEEEEPVKVSKADIYGEGHAFKSRGHLVWWTLKYITFFRFAQCIEYFYGTGVGTMLMEPLARVYDTDSDAYQAAIIRHLQPFITNFAWGHEIITVSIAMEEDIAKNGDPTGEKGKAIETFKSSMMGPMAGLGDSIEGGILMPMWKAVCYPYGLKGIIFPGAFAMWCWAADWMVMEILTGILGYEQGQTGVVRLLNSKVMKKLMYAAGIVGIIMMGAMSAGYCHVPINVGWTTSLGESVDLIATLNNIIPGILPLAYLTGSYFALQKGVKFTTLLLCTVVFGLICGVIGIC